MRSHGDRRRQIAVFRDSFEKIKWWFVLFMCGIKTKIHFECILSHWWSFCQLNMQNFNWPRENQCQWSRAHGFCYIAIVAMNTSVICSRNRSWNNGMRCMSYYVLTIMYVLKAGKAKTISFLFPISSVANCIDANLNQQNRMMKLYNKSLKLRYMTSISRNTYWIINHKVSYICTFSFIRKHLDRYI